MDAKEMRLWARNSGISKENRELLFAAAFVVESGSHDAGMAMDFAVWAAMSEQAGNPAGFTDFLNRVSRKLTPVNTVGTERGNAVGTGEPGAS